MYLMIITLISSIFSICLLAAISYSLFVSKTNEIIKRSNWILLAIESVVAIINFVFIICWLTIKYENRNELILNVELIILILNVVVLALFLCSFSKQNKANTNYSKKYKLIINIFNGVNYVSQAIILVCLFVLMGLGAKAFSALGDPSELRNNLDAQLWYVKWIFLLGLIIASGIFIAEAVLTIWQFFKDKSELGIASVTKAIAACLGTLISVVVMSLLFATFMEMTAASSFLASEFIDFILKSYTNTMVYVILYLEILGSVSMSIYYLPNSIRTKAAIQDRL